MDPGLAHRVALGAHRGQLDRYGSPLIEHVERVAAVVPERAQAVAYLHELLERSPVELATVDGLSDDEAAAIELLTREPGETYEVHAMRIAHAKGRAGTLARAVKLADLDDHLRHARQRGEPPYRWARQHIVICIDRYDASMQAA